MITQKDVRALGDGELHALWEYATIELSERGSIKTTAINQVQTGLIEMKLALARLFNALYGASWADHERKVDR